MSRRFKTVSSLQNHLKDSVMEAIQGKVTELCIEVVKDYIQRNVYDKYRPDPDTYDRTFELLNSVTVGNLNLGTKYATFEIFMDTEKINAHIRNGSHGYLGWNSHADVYDLDMSEYIPLWIEEGTEGSLWDREPAHYMYDSWVDLSGGELAKALADSLRRQGWDVIDVS
jgi:hypothetical protein